MNIKKFQLTEKSFEWADLAHNETIRFQVSDDKCFDIKINKDSETIEIIGTQRGGRDQFKVIPHCANSISVGYV